MTTFPTIPRYVCHERRVESNEFSSATAEVFVSSAVGVCVHAWVGDLCGVCGDMLSVRLMLGAGGAGLVSRASRDGLMRIARSGCAGRGQQTRAASAEVSVAKVLWKTLGLNPRSASLIGWEIIKDASIRCILCCFFLTVTLALRVCYSTISAHSKSIHTHIMCICASCLSVLTELQNINKEHTVHWLSLIHVSWSCWLETLSSVPSHPKLTLDLKSFPNKCYWVLDNVPSQSAPWCISAAVLIM